MVTLELAACLPVLALILAVALSAITVADARVRVHDAAREAVRAAARDDAERGRALAAQAAPGVSVAFTRSGDDVIAEARVRVRLLAGWLPTVTVTGRAVAAAEPTASSP